MAKYTYTAITTAELDAKLLNAIELLSVSFEELTIISKILYETGLRAMEVIDLTRWLQPAGGIVPIQLLKNEGIRNVPITPIIQTAIDRKNETGLSWRSVTYKYFDYHLTPFTGLLITDKNDKPTSTHAFRYLYIHKLLEDGWSPAAIQGQMHHLHLSSTMIYINEKIGIASKVD